LYRQRICQSPGNGFQPERTIFRVRFFEVQRRMESILFPDVKSLASRNPDMGW
jgi:hypothetical protein